MSPGQVRPSFMVARLRIAGFDFISNSDCPTRRLDECCGYQVQTVLWFRRPRNCISRLRPPQRRAKLPLSSEVFPWEVTTNKLQVRVLPRGCGIPGTVSASIG